MVGRFDGGWIISGGGRLLLREVSQRLGVLARLAACFTDYRNPNSIEHGGHALVAQRVYGLALGYEDLNDHDSVLALLVGKRDLTGAGRERARDKGYPLAGSSTLNRLELSTPAAAASDCYNEDRGGPGGARSATGGRVSRVARETAAGDLDTTDDPLHGLDSRTKCHGIDVQVVRHPANKNVGRWAHPDQPDLFTAKADERGFVVLAKR